MIHKIREILGNVTMGQGFALVCWSGIGEQAPISPEVIFYTCLQSCKLQVMVKA